MSSVASVPSLPEKRLGGPLAIFVVVSLYLLSAGCHVLFGALNTDEGFYAVATRAVAQGEVPYRDFGFTQPPLTLYVNSVPLRLTGYGLFAQRSVNGLWAAVAVALAAAWLTRRTQLVWGLVLALGFSLSAPWMYFIHLGKTYGLTTLIVMLAAWVFLSQPVGSRRNFLVGFLGVLGVATRLPAVPFFAILWLGTLWPGRRPAGREVLGAVSGPVVGLALVVLPFALVAPDNTWFWTVELHRSAVASRTWHLAWQEIATLAPAVWLLAVAAIVSALGRRRIFAREGVVFLASAAALGVNLLQGGVYEEYAVPFLLPLAASAAAWLHDELRSWRPVPVVAYLALLAVVQFGTAPVLLHESFPDRRGSPSSLLTPNAPRYNPALPDQLAAARWLVDQTLAKDAPLIGTNLILAAETGRAVPTELRMGSFAYTGEMTAERAARLHFATRDQLDRWFASPDTRIVAFFHLWDLNYGWSLPSGNRTAIEVRQHWLELLRRDYRVALIQGQFVVLGRKDTPAAPPGKPATTQNPSAILPPAPLNSVF
jgi:4-amino-4-deoxy-L-arabinose transferase-like glycosyltransferase